MAAEVFPGKDIGGELTVAHQDHIAATEGEHPGGEVQPEAGIGGERDLGQVGVEEASRAIPRSRQNGLQLLIGEPERGGAPLIEPGQDLPGPLRNRSGGGVVQVDVGCGPGELRVPEGLDVVGRAVGRSDGRTGRAARRLRGGVHLGNIS